MTQQIPAVRVPRVSPPARHQFRWEQDPHRRVLKLTGVIDAAAASRLESAIINLGSRRLLIDLSGVISLDPAGAAVLLQISRRLGPGRVSVAVHPDDDSGVVVTDVADFESLQHPV